MMLNPINCGSSLAASVFHRGRVMRAAALCAAVWCCEARAEPAASADTGVLQDIVVTAERLKLIGIATTASEGVVVNDELALAPAYRPGQLLESVPGLDVTSHSGEGKANQYLMRGYNLDHGTDLAIYVDDMPVNEPTHAHGQGYADVNFLIPELATNIRYSKGTYYAGEGDFASVGAVHLNYVNSLDDQIALTAGTLGFQRLFTAASQSVGEGSLLGALDLQHYDGPWSNPDDQRKIDAVLRYSRSDEIAGLRNEWLAGLSTRFDFNDVSRVPTLNRVTLPASADPRDVFEQDRVHLSDVAVYAQATTHWRS